MRQNGATDRAVGRLVKVKEKIFTTGDTEDTEGHRVKPSLDAGFRAHLFFTFFQRRDSESVPAVVAAHSGVRRVQGAWPLSRLLVLDTARAAVAISASVETESCA